MNYAQQEAPKRRTAGLAFVIVLHIGIVYLLLTGLASKVVEVIRQPIEAIGQQAMCALIERLKHPGGAEGFPIADPLQLETELIARESI